jgi:FixJ family two-component response regulator
MEARTFLTQTAPSGLTGRQRQVLLGLIKGQSEKEVATSLDISFHTVHFTSKPYTGNIRCVRGGNC